MNKLPGEKDLICLDSVCIIDAITGAGSYAQPVQEIIRRAEDGEIVLLLSEVSVAEVTHIRKTEVNGPIVSDEDERTIKSWFNRSSWMRRPVDSDVSELAATLIRNHNVATCDAMICATALIYNAKALVTRDGHRPDQRQKHTKLLALDGKLMHQGHCLRIRDPLSFAGAFQMILEVPSGLPVHPNLTPDPRKA